MGINLMKPVKSQDPMAIDLLLLLPLATIATISKSHEIPSFVLFFEIIYDKRKAYKNPKKKILFLFFFFFFFFLPPFFFFFFFFFSNSPPFIFPRRETWWVGNRSLRNGLAPRRRCKDRR